MSTANSSNRSSLGRFSGPVKIGLAAATLALVLALVGIARGNVPLNPLSILLALGISAGSWGLVAWAVATAACDVEADLAEVQQAAEAEDSSNATSD
ncbi:MAG: hypothetical protein U9R25_08860 [Chloroflexota bacterium]|nr:hypothetical protein [Chloroflexota bacterium]